MTSTTSSKPSVDAFLEQVLEYQKLDWVLARARPGEKRPVDTGWQTAPIPDEQTLTRWFANGAHNPGLRLGPVSGNVHDIDCDDERIVPYLNALAPPWAEDCPRWARGKRPHILVRTERALSYRSFKAAGKVILEVRGDGHQSLLPPSVHPSGDTYRWIEGPHDPPLVNGDEVFTWAEDACLALGLSLGWVEGSRHEVAMAFAGWLARKSVDDERCKRIVSAVAHVTADPEADDRVRAVIDSYDAVSGSRSATGWPTLGRLLPKEATDVLGSVWPHGDRDEREERAGAYVAVDGEVYRITRGHDGEEQRHELANFDVRIVRELLLDDGSDEVVRELELEGIHKSGARLRARIPSSEFSGMNWLVRELGGSAIVAAGAGKNDQLREATQRLSGKTQVIPVYRHTGWRELEGRMVFLHAGLSDEFSLELDQVLRRYALPTEPANLARAIEACFELLDVSDSPGSSVLLSAMFAAPLSEIMRPDFSVWVWGPTGSYKSTVVALFLSLFGSFERKTLPADWSSTPNALERLAFVAKDLPLVIDEFAPGASPAEQRKLNATASRLLRAQGNIAGRARMRADTSIRSALEPRGLIIATAESPPPLPQSAVARTLLVEVHGKDVDLERLSALQKESELLSHAMAAYISWISNNWASTVSNLPDWLGVIRTRLRGEGHPRLAETTAHLELGMFTAVSAFTELGFLSQSRGDDILVRVRASLEQLGEENVKHGRESHPGRLFLSVLAQTLGQKSAFLRGRHGDHPPGCEQLGWEARESGDGEVSFHHAPAAENLGWADDAWLYLIPAVSYRFATRFLEATDRTLSSDDTSLHRALADMNAIEVATDGRMTKAVKLEGTQKRVLKVRRELLEDT